MIEETKNLIVRCKENDRKAQNELFKNYYSLGMSIALRYHGDRTEAKATLVNAFYKVFKNLDSFDESRDFKPWFCRIVTNTAINEVKKIKRTKFSAIEESEMTSHVSNPALSDMTYQEMLEVVQKLSNAYRTVFNMYVIDGYSHKEIAEKLGITVGTSKSNLTRAKQKLRELLVFGEAPQSQLNEEEYSSKSSFSIFPSLQLEYQFA